MFATDRTWGFYDNFSRTHILLRYEAFDYSAGILTDAYKLFLMF